MLECVYACSARVYPRTAPWHTASQVHDELIFSEREDRADKLEAFVRREMTEALPLDVPVVVDVAVGRNWAEC